MVILDYTFKCTTVVLVTHQSKILTNHTVTFHQTHSDMGEVRQRGYVRKPPDS